MTSKIVVNNIEADAGVSTVTFGSDIQGNLIGNVTSSSTSTFSNGINVTGGSVGIGTDNPTFSLQVQDDTESLARFRRENTGSNHGGIIVGNQSRAIKITGGGDGLIITDNTLSQERLRITSTGNVGIGTTNPGTEFEVLGGGTVATFKGTGGNCFIGMQDVDDGTLGFVGVDSGHIKLQTSGSSYADKLIVDPAGRVTTPYQPAFVAYLSSNFGYSGGGSRQLVPFDTTLNNIGGHFNTSTNRFVAPVAGMYIFTASLVCNSGSSSTYFSCDIWVNGSYVPGSNGWQNMGAGYQIQRSSLITYLAVNDYVDVRMEKSANNTINGNDNYSGFTGALLG